jgi:hypothetical protein
LLLQLPGAHGLNLALQAGAAALLLSAAWLWREARTPFIHKEISHAQ